MVGVFVDVDVKRKESNKRDCNKICVIAYH